jgi:hypothetical protein
MNIILTWSRKFSHQIALILKDWLPEVIPGVDPWVSSEDIQKGKKWFPELMNKFKETCFSITCITTENVLSPWVYYEVGLIAAKNEEGIVCPYLVGVPGKLISDTPLSAFQWTEADKADTWKLVKSINTELKDKGHDEAVLEGNFKSLWPKLKSKLEKIVTQMGEIEEEVTQISKPQVPDLRDVAKKLLIAATKDPNGIIMYVKSLGGTVIQANGKDMISSPEPREVARWKGALDELQQYGYIEGQGHQGVVFKVTDAGFERADQLIAEDPILSLPEEAKQILLAASKGNGGNIQFVTFDGGFQILAGGQGMIENEHDAKTSAGWKHGLDQLFKAGLLDQTQHKDMFRLNKAGYTVVNDLFPDTASEEASED